MSAACCRPAFTPLVGRFVRLDPLLAKDLPTLYRAIGLSGYRAPHRLRWRLRRGPAGLQDTESGFVEWALGRYPLKTCIPYGIRLIGGQYGGEMIGTTALGDFDLRREATHLGWTAYDPRVWVRR